MADKSNKTDVQEPKIEDEPKVIKPDDNQKPIEPVKTEENPQGQPDVKVEEDTRANPLDDQRNF